MAVRVNPLLLAGTTSLAPSYLIPKSFRARGSSQVVTWRDFPSAGNRKKWTWSGWVKRGGPCNTYQVFFGSNQTASSANDSTYHTIAFNAAGNIGVSVNSAWLRQSAAVYRDKHAWYHVVVAYDTPNADPQARCRMWVNGEEITAWNINTTITQNIDHGINNINWHGIGAVNYSAAPAQFDGLIANVHFIDGLTLPPTDFGEFNSTTGQWVPKLYTGTFPLPNSFWLDFNTDWTSGSSEVISGYTQVSYYSGSGYWNAPSNFYDLYADLVGGGGGGGAGADAGGGQGVAGGYTQFNGAVAYAGGGGVSGYGGEGGGGAGGTWSADAGTNGFAGSTSSSYSGGAGGWSGNGGSGGSQPGAGSPGVAGGAPGGGGSGGGGFLNAQGGGGGGGGGAYARINYSLANVSPGQALYYSIGTGGGGDPGTYAGGPGAAGSLHIFYRTKTVTGGTFYKGMGDKSGNGNHWTPNSNFRTDGVYNDLLTDTPTDNVPPVSGLFGGYDDFWAGTVGYNPNASWGTTAIPFVIPPGKWFMEGFCLTVAGAWYAGLGMIPAVPISGIMYVGDRANSMGAILGSTAITAYQNNVPGSAITRTFGTNVSLAMAIDTIAGKAWLGGGDTAGGYSWIGGGNPDAGTNPTYTFNTALEYVPAISMYNNTTHWNVGHLGQALTTLKPASFKWFRASNFDAPSIVRGDDAFQADIWSGNNAIRKIANRFDPVMAWVKHRSSASYSHVLVDRDRGDANALIPDSPRSELALADSIFLSTTAMGYEVGQAANTNATGGNYVGWSWRKGAAYGCDVQGYAGDGVNGRNIPHGLGAKPEFMLVKKRNGADANWVVYHRILTALNFVSLNANDASASNAGVWNNTEPTPSVFTVGSIANVNTSGDLYMAYLFRAVPGFSKFHSYAGNGNAFGPMVLTGFRPALVLIKRQDSAGNWLLYDNKRDVRNPVQSTLFPDIPDAEYGAVAQLDFMSNGFKIRTAGGSNNISGATYIYAAFAESPFLYSNAR